MPCDYVAKGVLQMDRTNREKAFYHSQRVDWMQPKGSGRMFDVKVMILQDACTHSKKKSDGKTFVPMLGKVNRVFSPEQENRIVDYPKKLARMIYGLNVIEFLKLVYTYAIAVGSKVIPKAWERDQSASPLSVLQVYEATPNYVVEDS